LKTTIVKTLLLGLLCGLWWAPGDSTKILAGDEAGIAAVSGDSAGAWQTYRFDFNIDVKASTEKPEFVQPFGWERVVTKAGSPDFDQGHCRDNMGEVVPDEAWKNWYLKLTLESGKISYQTCTYPGAGEGETFIPVSEAKSYRLETKIKTQGFEQPLRPTGAYVSILWFEKPANEAVCRYSDGTPIIFTTQPIARDTGGEWREVGLTMDAVPPGAKYAKIRCTLEGKGIRSVAMFDDIVLSEGPHVALETGRMVPLYAAGEEMRLTFVLDGLRKGKYSEEITTEAPGSGGGQSTEIASFDVDSETKLQRPYTVQAGGFGVFRLRYVLKDAGGNEIAQRSLVLARVPKTGRMKYAEKYGVCFNYHDHPYAFVGNYIYALGAGVMKTSLWSDAVSDGASPQQFLRFADDLRRMGIRSVGVLGKSPVALTKRMGLTIPLAGRPLFDQPKGERKDALWAFLKEDLSAWAALLDGVQIAPDGDTSFNGPVADITSDFAARMPSPLASARCAIPAAAASTDALPQGADVISLQIPAKMSPEDLAKKIAEARALSTVWVTLSMKAQGPAQIDDMLRKITVCLASGVDKIFLPLDSPDAGLIRMIEYPNESAELTPAFAAFKFFTRMLDGAAFVERFEMGPVEIYLFEKDGASLAATWSNAGEVDVPVYWGEGLEIYDQFGNRLEAKSANGETIIGALGATPRVITGMNPSLMRTWRSLQVVTKSIEASIRDQAVELAMQNHFDKNIDCTVKLQFDGGLEHLYQRPYTASFSLAPGGSWSSGAAFSLRPSISDTVGGKAFRAVVTVNTEEGRFTLEKTLSIELVPSPLELRLVGVSRQQGGIVIRIAAKNNGAEGAGVNLYASSDSSAAREGHVSIPRLEPGAEVEVEFSVRLENGALPGGVWLGLREINGRRFVNISLDRGQIEAALNK